MKVIYNIPKRNILELSTDSEKDFMILKAFLERCAITDKCKNRQNVPFFIAGIFNENKKIIIKSEYITTDPVGTMIKNEGSVISFLQMNGIELQMLQPLLLSQGLEDGLLTNQRSLNTNIFSRIFNKLRIK